MAFTLPDMSCLALEGSSDGTLSPSSSTKRTTARTGEQQQQQQQQQRVDGEPSDGSGSGNTRMPRSNSRPNLVGDGGGLLSFSWFDKHREKRRREHLKQEAEKQLQKIAEAQRAAARKKAAAAAAGTHGPVNRTQSLISLSSSSSSDAGGGGGAVSCLRSSTGSGSWEATAAAAEKSSTSKSSSSSSRRKHRGTAQRSNSCVSKSGEGASGTLDLSDIEVLENSDNNHGESANASTNENENANEKTASQNEEKNDDDAGTNSKDDDDNDDNDESVDITPPVRVTQVEDDDASPYILSQNQMNEIARHVLPETISYCRWRRLYGLGRDGDSFEGCLRIIGAVKRTLMVVRTTKGDIFGGYADAPWHSRKANATAHFYGSASSCLFSFNSTLTEFSRSSSPDDASINVYRWTGKNRYIQVCDVSSKMLAFGGGGDKGAFGLCLQEDFQRGTTGHCDTFDNDPLCSSHDRTFDIVDVEFWEFLTGVF